jgi:hypothetical protein
MEENKGEISMFTRNLFILLCALSLAACTAGPAQTPAATPPADRIKKEEQAVYAFFLSEVGEPAVILQNTASFLTEADPEESMEYVKSVLDGISDESFKNYMARNAQSVELPADMNLGVKYVLLTRDELAEIGSQPNWGKLLAERYPGSNGYTIFSRVGFNNSFDQALVYVANVGGPLVGSGSYYLMEKKNGAWAMIEQVNVWMS